MRTMMPNQWIDIKEEIPEDWHPVLIWIGDGCAVGHRDSGIWRDIFGFPIEEDVIAWKPLPFGPKGQALVSNRIKYWK